MVAETLGEGPDCLALDSVYVGPVDEETICTLGCYLFFEFFVFCGTQHLATVRAADYVLVFDVGLDCLCGFAV